MAMKGFTSLGTKEPSSIDLEAGGEATLYPGLSVGENQLRWGFIRKVYGILAAQLVLTTVVSSVTVLSPPVNDLLKGSPGLMLFFIILPFVYGSIVLEALILTSAVVSALTAYTFWASKKGKDFSYLGPILFSCLMVLVVTSFMQMFFPLGPVSNAIYGGIGAMIFSGYVVYDTDNLIKRHTYDEYIWASVTLYLDILNLFLTILRMMRSSD